jgi:hypothetical protein
MLAGDWGQVVIAAHAGWGGRQVVISVHAGWAEGQVVISAHAGLRGGTGSYYRPSWLGRGGR